MDPTDEKGRENTGDQCALERGDPFDPFGAFEPEAEADAAEDRVGNAATDENDSFDDDIRADDAADDRGSKSSYNS